MALPNYHEAMKVVEGLLTKSKMEHALKLVAPYIDIHALPVCLRVCKEWNRTLTAELWAEPLEAITHMQYPFSRAIRFRNNALDASPFARSQLTTLSFEKLLLLWHDHQLDWSRHDSTFGISWLFSFMHLFPNLRFAILDELPGYSAMLTRDDYDAFLHGAIQNKAIDSIYKPIMLSARGCRNLDGSQAMVCTPFSNLWYLDLSYSNWQEDWGVRFSSTPLQNLRVLKLRGLRFTDNNFAYMLRADLGHLWSLDIRDNLFTDVIIPHIDSRLLLPPTQLWVPDENEDQQLYENTPAYSEYNNETDDQLTSIRPDSREGFMKYLQDHGKFSSPEAEFLNENDPLSKKTGLTQLYLSGNQFSHQSIQLIIRGNSKLQVFDCGTIREKKDNRMVMGQPHSGLYFHRARGNRFEIIRMHHSLVTYCMTTHGVESNAKSWSLGALEVDEAEGKQASSSDDAFSPLDNHRITSLTLTGIPTHSYGFIVQRLIEFLRECREQEELIQKARAEPRFRFSPIILPGLRNLTLEFIPPMKTQELSRQNSAAAGSSSVSGDKDADNFRAESNKDFSFFSSFATGAAGLGTQPGGQRKKVARVVQKKLATPKLDVVAELKAFRRREKKWGGNLQLLVPHYDTLLDGDETTIGGK